MASYARIEKLLRDIEDAASEMVERDWRLVGLAEDVRGEIVQLGHDLTGAPDEALSAIDRALLDRAAEGIEPLLLELQLQSVPPDRTGVGVDHSFNVIGPYRSHIRIIQEVLRR